MLAAGLLHLRRLPGVLRPAIAVPIPTRDGASLLLDARRERRQPARAPAPVRDHGVDLRRRRSSASPSPTVRLLSIGEEPEKGNQLTLEAHALLRDAAGLNFAGNAEARDLLRGAADVVVTDGFTGNMALKLLEGDDQASCSTCCARRSRRRRAGKLGGLLIRPGGAADPRTPRPGHLRRRLPARPARPRRDRPRQLGPAAIANAIRLAARGAEHRVVERLAERLPERARRDEPAVELQGA